MRIVALDTTGAFGSIALLEAGELIEELPLHSPEGFSQILFDQLRRILDRHDWRVRDVDCFASASGPGSFTGVRVGLAAAKGLAEATGRAAAGVSNLAALAACGSSEVRGAMLDARRGEVYGAVYDSRGVLVRPEMVVPFPAWVDSLPENVTEIVCTDFAPFRASFQLSVLLTEQRILAGAVARIAYSRLLSGQATDPAAIDANYVRRADAELKWKDASLARTP